MQLFLCLHYEQSGDKTANLVVIVHHESCVFEKLFEMAEYALLTKYGSLK